MKAFHVIGVDFDWGSSPQHRQHVWVAAHFLVNPWREWYAVKTLAFSELLSTTEAKTYQITITDVSEYWNNF